jgi:hypothetical protein
MLSASIVDAMSRSLASESGTLDAGTVEAFNLNLLQVLDQEPSSDPVCGRHRHDTKSAGCKDDLKATRWFSDDCYNPGVHHEFLNETESDVFFQDSRR